ncbi:ABC-2 type transport system permease protein [Comamonas sp. BIGb0152]|uniref:DUF3526 domain-containing protein n=1 Tax=Comamonas sp. BIGb0152 TaxID=2940601 RepID=UPI0021678D9E|nr:DUF3526 domain-containing protein [Comamonas sp. BIGb0152]MCS4292563.1 ABC-2 type transport system permease protein [Comamonas sp. BIGb0152]
MNSLFEVHYWRAEASKFARQPSMWVCLAALLLVSMFTSISAGLDARAWRAAAANDESLRAQRLDAVIESAHKAGASGPALATATYQAGRGELGSTRMPVKDGLVLGVQSLRRLPSELKVSLENSQVDAREPGPIKNPLLSVASLPGIPAMTALLLPLVALILCAGLMQEEREQGRLSLLRVQSSQGIGGLMRAALAWRFIALWMVAFVSTLPAFALDPGSSPSAALGWLWSLAVFTFIWVVIGGLLSYAPISGAASMLSALGIWLALTFVVPAAIVQGAQMHSPMPSRLSSIVKIRDVQQESEAHEQELAQTWYAKHPDIPVHLPAVWPASFVVRALQQEQELRAELKSFEDARQAQSAFVEHWSWLSPGLNLVLAGERLAGVDVQSHLAYMHQVDSFRERWREFLVPRVMDRKGLAPDAWSGAPCFCERVYDLRRGESR